MVLEKRSIAVSEDHQALVDMAGPTAKFGTRTAQVMSRYKSIIDAHPAVAAKFTDDQLAYVFRHVSCGDMDTAGPVPIALQLEFMVQQDAAAAADGFGSAVPEDAAGMVRIWKDLSRGEELALIEAMERQARAA